MSATCAGVSGALLKSKVNLSGPTNEPFCEASWLDDFVQRPVQQMRDGVMALDGVAADLVHSECQHVDSRLARQASRLSLECSKLQPEFTRRNAARCCRIFAC